MSPQTQSSELLPCPFCGKEGHTDEMPMGGWNAGCRSAACRGHIAEPDDDEVVACYFDEAAAIAAWNRRTPATEPAAAFPELMQKLAKALRVLKTMLLTAGLTKGAVVADELIADVEMGLEDPIAKAEFGEPAAAALTIPPELQPETADLVIRFASAMADKFYKAQVKYGYDKAEWRRDDWMQQCQAHLLEHLAKGDPRDVANYCAFMWHHGWSTAAPVEPAAAGEAGPVMIPLHDGAFLVQEGAGWLLHRGSNLIRGLNQFEREFVDCALEAGQRIANPPAAQPLPSNWLPDEGAYIIKFDDADRPDEFFAYGGAKAAALARYKQISGSWNAHLFVKIDSNSGDVETPSAQPLPAGGVDANDQEIYKAARAAWENRDTKAVLFASFLHGFKAAIDWLARSRLSRGEGKDAKDAARYRWIKLHARGGYGEGAYTGQRFMLPEVPVKADIMRGGVAGHLDDAIDAAIASDAAQGNL